ncbi:hypothetical protein ILUMI_18964 [Ignelater luminosus]|uniref:Peptidase S1 domain-containing protein n=1 Tax=Ignelater luminosus TaxID=2038154 RepID=A0A8K0CML0_IGNLU|nr:hypothetical protein ILUMI_18964 [Ignelater luminosus]
MKNVYTDSRLQVNDVVESNGFIAMLYNDNYPSNPCAAAMISRRWVLDNCVDDAQVKYQYIKVGEMTEGADVFVYSIRKSVTHESYKEIPFEIEGYNAQNTFATVNAIRLHKSSKLMYVDYDHFIEPIHMFDHQLSVELSYTTFMTRRNGKLQMRNEYLPIVNSSCCNHHFGPYFKKDHKTCLDNSQLCVPISNSITTEECCNSQAFMVYNNSLLGIMAWSTICSEETGLDPWVFSHVGYYKKWIVNVICKKGRPACINYFNEW